MTRLIAVVASALSLFGCTSETPPQYSAGTLTVEVDYVAGAEPYVGASGNVDDLWRVTQVNLAALVGADTNVVVPQKLSDMESVDRPPGQLDRDHILALADAHRDLSESDSIYVLWFDDVLVANGERKSETVAIALENTSIVAVFKPVVDRLPFASQDRRVGEQVAVVHELGHTMGLVDRAVPMVRYHRFSYYSGHHCIDPTCVMHPSGTATHIADLRAATDDVGLVLFGDRCLEDARAVRD